MGVDTGHNTVRALVCMVYSLFRTVMCVSSFEGLQNLVTRDLCDLSVDRLAIYFTRMLSSHGHTRLIP